MYQNWLNVETIFPLPSTNEKTKWTRYRKAVPILKSYNLGILIFLFSKNIMKQFILEDRFSFQKTVRPTGDRSGSTAVPKKNKTHLALT